MITIEFCYTINRVTIIFAAGYMVFLYRLFVVTVIIGSVQYVLQIEPENRWFLNAKQKLLDYARAYFRDEGLGEEYYLHRSRLREKDE